MKKVSKVTNEKKILIETTPVTFDENKSPKELYNEGKCNNSSEYILGIDEDIANVKFKVYLHQIVCIISVRYVADMTVRPLPIVGQKYHVWHTGRRGSDRLNEETFNELVAIGTYQVIYYNIDEAHPLGERFNYRLLTADPPSLDDVNNNRREVMEKYTEELKLKRESSFLQPKQKEYKEEPSVEDIEDQLMFSTDNGTVQQPKEEISLTEKETSIIPSKNEEPVKKVKRPRKSKKAKVLTEAKEIKKAEAEIVDTKDYLKDARTNMSYVSTTTGIRQNGHGIPLDKDGVPIPPDQVTE